MLALGIPLSWGVEFRGPVHGPTLTILIPKHTTRTTYKPNLETLTYVRTNSYARPTLTVFLVEYRIKVMRQSKADVDFTCYDKQINFSKLVSYVDKRGRYNIVICKRKKVQTRRLLIRASCTQSAKSVFFCRSTPTSQ